MLLHFGRLPHVRKAMLEWPAKDKYSSLFVFPSAKKKKVLITLALAGMNIPPEPEDEQVESSRYRQTFFSFVTEVEAE